TPRRLLKKAGENFIPREKQKGPPGDDPGGFLYYRERNTEGRLTAAHSSRKANAPSFQRRPGRLVHTSSEQPSTESRKKNAVRPPERHTVGEKPSMAQLEKPASSNTMATNDRPMWPRTTYSSSTQPARTA